MGKALTFGEILPNMRYLLVFSSFFICTLLSGQSQKLPKFSQNPISANSYNPESFEETLRLLINEQRIANGTEEVQPRQVLHRAAYDQSSFMSEFDMMDQDDPGIRAMLYGGTKNVAEIVGKVSVKKDGQAQTYQSATENLLESWMKSSKEKEFLLDPQYFFCGIAATLSEDGKKIFVACMYGNQASFAFDLSGQAKEYISSKSYGLEGFDEKACRKIENAVDLHTWANGLYVQDGTLYLEHPNLKDIKRVVKYAEDGLAVDIIQRGQYDCLERNLVDYNRPYKGLIQKKVSGEDVATKNIATKDQKNRLVLKMGKLPNLTDTVFELNLAVVLKDHICANVKKSYVEIAPMNFSYKVAFSYYNDSKYTNDPIPSYEATDLAFRNNMCNRHASKWTANDQNDWNCLLSTFKLNGILNADEHASLAQKADRLATNGSIPSNMVEQLKITAALQALGNEEFPAEDKEKMIDFINDIDLSQESQENTFSIVQVFIKNGQYRSALKILDPYVKNPAFDEDLLFMHITLSALFQERVMSKLFVAEIQQAMERNPERICDLLTKKLSFQLFENTSLKDLVCTSCAIQK